MRFDPAGCERTADERPVGFDDAEHPVDGQFLANDAADDLDLFQDAVDELGAVAGARPGAFRLGAAVDRLRS